MSTPPQNALSAASPRLPSRRSAVSGFMVMDVMQAADVLEKGGRSIIHMEVGQPGTPAPAKAKEAVRKALERETLGYTLALGLNALRDRIALHYRDMYSIKVPRERIIVTSGSSAAFTLAFLALFDRGARIALASPGYPCYRHILTALDCETAILETGPETRWMPTPASLAACHERTPLDGVLIASPANPTGTMLEPGRLSALARECEQKGIWFISDEIYHGLTYGGGPQAATALAYSDEAIVINSFSKYFSMTGWRVGWMIVPERFVRTIERLQQNLFISAPAVSQVAALASFDSLDELETNRRTYEENRALLLDALPKIGLDKLAPADGAFYIYADVSDKTPDSRVFARQLLEEAGIAATPGLDFDEARGHRYLRFAYAGTTAAMREAASRLSTWHRLKR